LEDLKSRDSARGEAGKLFINRIEQDLELMRRPDQFNIQNSNTPHGQFGNFMN